MDISRRAICSLVAVAAFATLSTAAAARTLNGFDLKDSLVPPDQILPGGPGRDGIPAIDVPKFVKASAANLAAADRVLGLVGWVPGPVASGEAFLPDAHNLDHRRSAASGTTALAISFPLARAATSRSYCA